MNSERLSDMRWMIISFALALAILLPATSARSRPSKSSDLASTVSAFAARNIAGTHHPPNRGQAMSVATAATNAALSAMPSTVEHVIRTGYMAAGDVAPLDYSASASACRLNSGSGDGGSQIPTSDGKCWIASFPASGIEIRQFGAKCDNSTNDATAIGNALAYATTLLSSRVMLPGGAYCKINSSITVGDGVTLSGSSTNAPSGLSAGIVNLNPMIRVTGHSASLRDFFVSAGAAGMNSDGSVVSFTLSSGLVTVDNLVIDGPCNALDVNGSLHKVANVFVTRAAGNSCNAIQIGRLTTLGRSINDLFDHVTVSANMEHRPNSCWMIFDAGGLFVTHSDAISCKNGTLFMPGVGQSIDWPTFNATNLGDASELTAFGIDTGARTSVIRGLTCVECWASSSIEGEGISIQNTGRGVVSGLGFVGLRALNNKTNGIGVHFSADVSIADSWICNSHDTGIYIGSGVGDVRVSATVIRSDCMGQTGGDSAYGIKLAGSNDGINLANVDVRNNSAAGVSGVPTGNSDIYNITNPSNLRVAVASAKSIMLSTIHSIWTITGATGISQIDGGWSGRYVQLITTDGSIAFSTGGNICTKMKSVKNVPVLASFNGTCWYLK